MLVDEVVRSGGVSREAIDSILRIYSPDCRYVRSATLEADNLDSPTKRVCVRAELAVPYCYYALDKRGPSHFNATDFLLCFNQLTYVFLSEGSQQGFLPELRLETFEDFREAQVERCLISKFSDITFKRPINPRSFRGQVASERMRSSQGTVFYSLHSQFEDDSRGFAEGRCMIAVVPKKAPPS